MTEAEEANVGSKWFFLAFFGRCLQAHFNSHINLEIIIPLIIIRSHYWSNFWRENYASVGWCYHNGIFGVQMTASALLVIVLGLISSPFYFFALCLCSIPFHHSGFGVSGTRSPNNKEIVWLSFVIVLLMFHFIFILCMNILSLKSQCGRVARKVTFRNF